MERKRNSKRNFEFSVRNTASFTLIELLVVIGILGVLATAVVLVLNPAELLKQARDSTRLSDLASLNQTLSLFQTDQYNRSLGTSSVVYVSVPDSSPTCLNLGLPTLPGGWSYGCAPASTLQKVDGTGWIPVPLNLISSGSPLSKLPIDPVNATSTGNYYTYTPGGSWELTTILESQKQKMGGGSDKTSTDGGSYPELYEVGTDLSLLPISRDPSLVGYWKFDEGTGGTAYDASGHGNTGTLTNNPTWQTSASCVKGGCLSFDSSSNNYSNMGTSTSLNLQDSFSIVFWTYARSETAINPRIFAKYIDANNNYRVYSKGINATSFGARFIRNGVSYDNQANLPSFQWNTWYHVAVVFNGGLSFYINGSSVSNYAGIAPSIGADTNLYIAKSESGYFNGVVDNARIYNRALSAAEVAAIYNSGN